MKSNEGSGGQVGSSVWITDPQQYLTKGRLLPEWYTRPEVARILWKVIPEIPAGMCLGLQDFPLRANPRSRDPSNNFMNWDAEPLSWMAMWYRAHLSRSLVQSQDAMRAFENRLCGI